MQAEDVKGEILDSIFIISIDGSCTVMGCRDSGHVWKQIKMKRFGKHRIDQYLRILSCLFFTDLVKGNVLAILDKNCFEDIVYLANSYSLGCTQVQYTTYHLVFLIKVLMLSHSFQLYGFGQRTFCVLIQTRAQLVGSHCL